ncbi:MAG TPA: GNAT family N-acetyltransferase [Natronosporangium sp.]|nr:GNAT family N-acetyltransferase [Natronosporangium sp.]
MADISVRDNPDRHRYEVRSDGEPAGHLAYEVDGGRMILLHTEVDPRFGGQGLGRRLVVTALDDAAARGLAVVPVCPYVRRVITRDAERYLHLVAEDAREELGPAGGDG